MTLKRKILRDTAAYTAANYAAMAVGIVASVATKALLGAAGAGYWALTKVFMSYGEYSDLGTRDALSREIPQAAGGGDLHKAESIQNNVFAFTLVAGLFSAVALSVIAAFTVGDPALKRLLWIAAALVILTQVYNYFLTLLRSLKKITALSKLIFLNIVSASACSIAGAALKGVDGLAVGFVAGTAVSIAFGYRFSEIRLKPALEPREIGRLIRIGVPVVLSSYAFITFMSVDSMLIGRLLGFQALGYYTIALMAVQQVSSLGRFSSIVMFPHIQERYGCTKSLEGSKDYFIRATSAIAHAMPVVIASVYFLLPALVHYVLPRFEPGIPAMKVLVVGYFFMAVSELTSTVLFTMNKQVQLIPLYLAAVAVAAGSVWLLVRAGAGLVGVAAGMAIAYFVFFALMFLFAFRHILAGRGLLRWMGELALLFAYFLCATALADFGLRLRVPAAAEALLKWGAFLVLYVPVILRYEKKEKLIRAVAELLTARKEKPLWIKEASV